MVAATNLLDETAHDALDHTGLTGVGGGSGISAGTAFPGGPSTDDLFHRTDNDLIYFYDGTRWLCICRHEVVLADGGGGADQLTATSASVARVPVPTGSPQVWCEDVVFLTRVLSTNNGSNFWTVAVNKITVNAGTSVLVASHATSGDTVNNYIKDAAAVGAAIDSSTHPVLVVGATKTSSPGNLIANAVLRYRYIGT